MTQALRHSRYGEPSDVLELIDLDTGAPGPGEIVIRMEAAALHVADLRTVQGWEGFRFPLPRTPGFEGIGHVIAVGPDVVDFAVGARVFPPSASGTFREELRVRAADCLPAPAGDAAQLSLLTINAPTAWVLLNDYVRWQPGDWLVQNAANSSCGRFLVSLAREHGVRTVNVVRRAAAAEEVAALGGDVVLLDGDDLADRVLAATGGVRPKLGIDAVAGTATQRIAECVATGGTIVSYGAMSAQRCEIDFYLMFRHDLTLRGMSFRRELNRRQPAEIRRIYEELAARIADGRLQAKIAARYPLREWRAAFAQAARTGTDRDGKVTFAL